LRAISLLVILTMVIIEFVSCSGDNKTSIMNNAAAVPDISTLTGSQVDNTSNRNVIAVYDALIDPVAQTFTVSPTSERIAGYHFPLSQYFPNVLKITGYDWTPNFWADIKITHPFPGSGKKGYDPRVIAILPARSGVSFNYPELIANANNVVVQQPDGYTRLFDSLGGSIPGNMNPFKAYFKNNPYREWSDTGTISETQTWNLNLNGFAGSLTFKLVVDVSTHYPNSPEPVVDNAPEPVQMDIYISDGLDPEGGNAHVLVTLLDWQGQNGITLVAAEGPDLFNDIIELVYDGPGDNPNEYIYEGIMENSHLAPEGDYKILVMASDVASQTAIFKEGVVKVRKSIPDDPIDQTSPFQYFYPTDIFIDNNYAYVADYDAGIDIFDVTDLANPSWISRDDNWQFSRICVSGTYLYAIDGNNLRIFDVSDPTSIHIIRSTSLYSSPGNVRVSGDYAFVPCSGELDIVNINPPQTAHVEYTVDLGSYPNNVCLSGGYAYVSSAYAGLYIVDIDPVESAYVVNTIDTPGYANDVAISNGFAYVSDNTSGLQIIDIDPLETASIVQSISLPGIASGVNASGDYAFAVDTLGFYVIDAHVPESASIIRTIKTQGVSSRIFIASDYAFITCSLNPGIQIIDITNPESAFVVRNIERVCQSSNSVFVSGDYAYIADDQYGLEIVDMSIPERAYGIFNVDTPGIANDVFISSDYAYVADGSEGLQIIDIDPPESAYIVKTVDIPGSTDLVVEGDYAYIAAGGLYFSIVMINPPENAYKVRTVYTPDEAKGVCVWGDYAYVAIKSGGLQIIDIDPPDTAFTVNTIDTTGLAMDVQVKDGYAYVADNASGLQIIDVHPVESAHIVKTVSTPKNAQDVYILAGYAYVADNTAGLEIIDIYPPESAYIYKEFDTPGNAGGIFINGIYAYIADKSSLRTLKLW